MNTWKINLVGFFATALTVALILIGLNFSSIQEAELSQPWYIIGAFVLGAAIAAPSVIFTMLTGNKASNYFLMPFGAAVAALALPLLFPYAQHTAASVASCVLLGVSSGLVGSVAARAVENRS
ncbi:MAG: hypothetical protein K2W82_17970 [Candidatus Obscuribacterales bacterium]|nr:hypothetical protein [Candidatus Obscuribacterales bacterium]